jgi:hypothetical protein
VGIVHLTEAMVSIIKTEKQEKEKKGGANGEQRTGNDMLKVDKGDFQPKLCVHKARHRKMLYDLTSTQNLKQWNSKKEERWLLGNREGEGKL